MSDLLKVRVGGSSYLCKWINPRTVEIGGREYKTVKIGNQVWLAENLDYKFQYNGSTLPVGGSETPSMPAAWYYSNNEASYGIDGTYKCGLLYNGYAAKYLDDNKATLLPDGWHVPTENEWRTLYNGLPGGSNTAAQKLKSLDDSIVSGFPSSWNGTDEYGFKALPTGVRLDDFAGIGNRTGIWSTTPYDTDILKLCYIDTGTSIGISSYANVYAFSIRLVKAAT